MTGIKALPLGLAAVLLAGAPAWAHHSLAMFDRTKTLTLSGTVKEFQWTNPHAWVQLMVPDDKGVEQEWGFESGSPTALVRSGWTRRSLQPGDKITVTTNPLRDGSRGGSLNSVTFPDGRKLGQGGGGAPPPALPPAPTP